MIVLAAVVCCLQEPHPFFTYTTESMVSAYQAGVRTAKAKTTVYALFDPWKKDIGKARSPAHQSWTSSYAILECPEEGAYALGFKDSREYNDQATGEATAANEARFFDTLPKERRYVEFYVRLFAWPRLGGVFDNVIKGAASEDDVKKVNFVLIVDGGKPVHPILPPVPEGAQQSFGTVATTETHSSGVWVNGQYSTVTYTTDSTEGYAYYTADFQLKFPMYDENGTPTVPAGAKKLVLKTIKPIWEHSTEFDLSKLVRPSLLKKKA